MKTDLIFKDIPDDYVRENFIRIKRFLVAQPILRGEWKFFEIDFSQGADNLKFPHGFSFMPKDIIQTSIIGSGLVTWNYDLFDATNLDITVSEACTVRAFVGAYGET